MRTLLMVVLLAALGCGDEDKTPAKQVDAGDASPPAAGSGGAGQGEASGAGHAAAGRGSAGHGAAGQKADETKRVLPRLYPLVRASTPTALIADPTYQAQAYKIQPPSDGGVGVLPQALGEPISLAVAIRERFYSMGPTALLRIVNDLDDRVAGLDTDPSKHGCLTAEPRELSFSFPSDQPFVVRLQCMQSFGNPGDSGAGWVAFGFAPATRVRDDDAGVADSDAGSDDGHDAFYLLEGQEGGMGGAYRVDGDDVEGWIAVADSHAPMNSRVLMHLITHKAPATSELALAGAGVGFCSAHLKTSSDFVFVEGKTNAPPPPGTPMMPDAQYCDAARAGCFAVSALETALDPQDEGCRTIANASFEIRGKLDASNDASGNLMPQNIYMYFQQRPTAIAAF